MSKKDEGRPSEIAKQVYHPSHYNKEGKKECWDEMIEIFGPEAVVIFDVLSAYKYQYRAGLKDGNPEEQDLEKIKNYMKHASDILDEYYAEDERSISMVASECWYNMADILGF